MKLPAKEVKKKLFLSFFRLNNLGQVLYECNTPPGPISYTYLQVCFIESITSRDQIPSNALSVLFQT